MTTNADIITRSLRKLNAVALGATPDPSEQANALTVLRAFYSDTFDSGGYGPLIDTLVSTPIYAATPQQRVIGSVNITTLTLPTGAPERSAIETNDPTGVRAQLVWDGSTWLDLDTIALTDLALVPQSMVEELASYLAVALAADYAQPASAFDTAAAGGFASDVAAGLAGPRFGLIFGVPTVADIIRGAASKLIGARAQNLTSFQMQTALEALRGLFQEWAAQGVFGAMWDAPWIVGGEQDIYPGSRVPTEANPHLHLQDRFTRWLGGPCGGYDGGAGWYDYGWSFGPVDASWGPTSPRDLSITVVPNADGGDSSTYVYDAQAGAWANLSKAGAYYDSVANRWTNNLNLPCPLAQKYAETLKAALAVRIADDMGVEAKPTTVLTARRGISAMSQRWDSMRDVQHGVYF